MISPKVTQVHAECKKKKMSITSSEYLTGWLTNQGNIVHDFFSWSVYAFYTEAYKEQ